MAAPDPLLKVSDPPPTVADVMTPNPRTCSLFSTVLEAAMIFRDANCGAVPVLDDGRPVGVLTDRDVALALTEFNDLSSRTVRDIMTQGVVTVAPDDPLETVMDRFGDEDVRRLLVIDAEGQLRGIVSWVDLIPHLTPQGLGQVVSRIRH